MMLIFKRPKTGVESLVATKIDFGNTEFLVNGLDTSPPSYRFILEPHDIRDLQRDCRTAKMVDKAVV